MQDTPTPEELLAAVAAFLRDEAGPALARHGEGALAYHAKVAANMLGTAGRQLQLAPGCDQEEQVRLAQLLGVPGADLATLNQALAERLSQPDHGLPAGPLAMHLWRSALDKLAVDQPRYVTAQRVEAARAEFSDNSPDAARWAQPGGAAGPAQGGAAAEPPAPPG